MHEMLHDIADLLRAGGLTIDVAADPADTERQAWDVSDVPGESVIRVMVLTDTNGHPAFWTPAFASYAAKYIAPIVTRIGDARDEVIQRHVGDLR